MTRAKPTLAVLALENVAPSSPDSEPVPVAERATSFKAYGDDIAITIPKDDAGNVVLAGTAQA